jgi:hypothetical protein
MQGRELALSIYFGGLGRDGSDNKKADNIAFDSEGFPDPNRGVVEFADW